MARTSWFDEKTDSPLIDDYARQLGTFLETMADGRVDADELRAHEARLVALMKQVEPKLDDQTHELVTQLLCEMSAYSIVQVLHGLYQEQEQSQMQHVRKLIL